MDERRWTLGSDYDGRLVAQGPSLKWGEVVQVASVDSERLYLALAFFDTRDGSPLAELVRAAREGYERAGMGESGAWDEFDRIRASLNARERERLDDSEKEG